MAKGVYTLASLAGGSAGGSSALCAISLAVACERIRPSERPSPPASAPENRELAREAEALVHVSGTVVSDAVLGTHELALTVVNRSRWTLTELRVAVEFDPGREASSKEYVLRTRGGVGPGQSETLVARLDGDAGYGRPPAWRFVGAIGYPSGS